MPPPLNDSPTRYTLICIPYKALICWYTYNLTRRISGGILLFYFCITLYTATKTITDFNKNVLKWISVQLHIKPTPKLGKLEKSKC